MINTPSSPRAHGSIRTLVAFAVSIALFLVGCSSVSNDGDVLEQPEQPDTSLPVIAYTSTSLAVAPDDSPNNSATDSTSTEDPSGKDSSAASNPAEGSSPDSRSVPQNTPLGVGHSFEDASYVFCDENINIYTNSQSCLLLTEDVIQQVDCIKEPLAEHFGKHFPPESNLRPALLEALYIAFGDPPSETPASEELVDHVTTCGEQAGASLGDFIDDSAAEETLLLQIIDISARLYCTLTAVSFAQLPISECRSALSPDGICVSLTGTIAFGGWDPQTTLNNCQKIGAELSNWISNLLLGIEEDSIEDILESLDDILQLDDVPPLDDEQNSEAHIDNPDQSVTLTPGEITTFSGEGMEAISLDTASAEFSHPWILEAVHEGSEEFAIIVLNDAGIPTEWTITTLGDYRGRRIFGFDVNAPPAFIKVRTDGAWTIHLMDPSDPSTTSEISSASGTSFTGSGNDILRFRTGEQARTLDFECESCESAIFLVAIGDFNWREDGILIGRWGNDGTLFRARVEVPANTNFLEITTSQSDQDTGEFTPHEWSIQVQ